MAFYPGSTSLTTHDSAAWNAVVDGILATHCKGATEPNVVYNLFSDPAAVADWQSAFSGWTPQIRYGAVFVHQRPYASFVDPSGKSVRCELSDLLVLVHDPANSPETAAALYQAKMAGATSWPPSGKQWDLYTGWPTFKCTLKAQQFFTLPFSGSHDPAGNYLELDTGAPDAIRLRSEQVRQGTHFGDEIYQLTSGSSGRPVREISSAQADDWDRLIDRLVTHTASQATGPSIGGQSRGAGDLTVAMAMQPPGVAPAGLEWHSEGQVVVFLSVG